MPRMRFKLALFQRQREQASLAAAEIHQRGRAGRADRLHHRVEPLLVEIGRLLGWYGERLIGRFFRAVSRHLRVGVAFLQREVGQTSQSADVTSGRR